MTNLDPSGRVIEPPREYPGVAMLMSNPGRARSLIVSTIKELELDLSGLTVLTEAATREYAVTPIIAAAAGARVYALASFAGYTEKSARWRHARDAERTLITFANMCGVRERVEVVFERPQMVVEQADIVTNLRNLRPLREWDIKMMKPGSIILCMHEEWEARGGDIDLTACRNNKIPVVYTTEGELFSYCGLLCAKMLFEAGLEVFRNKIVIVGGDNLADAAAIRLSAMGAEVIMGGSNWLAETKSCDAVVMADLRSTVGVGDGLDIPIIRLAEDGHMPKTLAHLGVKPVIEIHALGFKTAAEFLAKRKGNGERKRSKGPDKGNQ